MTNKNLTGIKKKPIDTLIILIFLSLMGIPKKGKCNDNYRSTEY